MEMEEEENLKMQNRDSSFCLWPSPLSSYLRVPDRKGETHNAR